MRLQTIDRETGFSPRHNGGAGSRRLLLLDGDAGLRTRLGRALERAGLDVAVAASLEEARALIGRGAFAYAVVDLRLRDGHGLGLIGELRAHHPDVRVVVLTAFGSIASAVLAAKAGVSAYLAKPADAEDILEALAEPPGLPPPPELPMPADRVRWEHIQRVFEQCGRNVSATARQLGMHRRSLQRMLGKRAPREQSRAAAAVLAPALTCH